jgi:maltose O-acetyltransferase
MSDLTTPEDGRTQRERMLAGDPYIADDPVLAEESRRAMSLLKTYNGSAPDDAVGRRRILEELLGELGPGSEIRPPLYCDYGYQLRVGARTFVRSVRTFSC